MISSSTAKTDSSRTRRALAKSPDWRWRRALDLSGNRASTRHDDAFTLAAMMFVRRERDGIALPVDRPIREALTLYLQQNRMRWELDALLLARCTSRTIAPRLHLERKVIQWYRALFCDTRIWLRHQLSLQAICGASPLTGISPDDLASLWKCVACQFGLAMLDPVVAITTGVGTERFTAELLENAALYIEQTRVPLSQPRKLIQMQQHDLQIATGRPLSVLYRPRRKRATPVAPTQK